jgi:hypothetical protein
LSLSDPSSVFAERADLSEVGVEDIEIDVGGPGGPPVARFTFEFEGEGSRGKGGACDARELLDGLTTVVESQLANVVISYAFSRVASDATVKSDLTAPSKAANRVLKILLTIDPSLRAPLKAVAAMRPVFVVGKPDAEAVVQVVRKAVLSFLTSCFFSPNKAAGDRFGTLLSESFLEFKDDKTVCLRYRVTEAGVTETGTESGQSGGPSEGGRAIARRAKNQRK